MWTDGTKKLSEEQLEHIKTQFFVFYNDYADVALPGQVDFVDSIYDQFKTKEFLTDKQIAALDNIITACHQYDDDDSWAV